jgi:DNA-binding winged helix-turn-helix (wHTH) protein/TolB-like protein/Tfp pilus assembly protein PilF
MKTGSYYEFGEFRLEPAEQLLTRKDRAIPLPPKAFDLLVYLVQNHGRLVAKDQIMQTVWPGSFVEEANLTVTISLLRKALGDKESGSQHIETVPKKGYRFVAAVSEGELGDGAMPRQGVIAGPPESAPRPFIASPGSTKGPVALEAPAAPLSPSAEMSAAAGSATLERKRRPRFMFLSTVAVATVVLGTAAYFYRQHPLSVTPSQPSHSLAILPLKNLGRDPGTDFLSLSLADALITKLDYVSSLSVRPSSAVEKYRGQLIDLQSVAADLRVDTLLTGGFLRDGENLRVTYQLVDVKGEKLLGHGSIDVKFDDLLRVQDSVAEQIIGTLQLKLSPAEANRIKPGTPVSPLAYEYYLRGVDLHEQHKFPLAIKMLEKSTEIDPGYALAWAYLGASYTSDAAFELGGREQYRRAQTAYERALAIEPSQLAAQMFLANLLVDTGRVEEAMPLLRRALQANGNYAPLHWELGYAYRFAGLLDESIAECEHALRLDPWVRGGNGSVLNAYLYRGEYTKFLDSLPKVENSAFLLFYRGLGEYYLKDWNRAENDFDRAFELDASLYTRVGKALSDSLAHREADGLQILRGLETEIAQRGVGDPEGTYKIAQSYAALGDSASALRVLRGSVESGFFPYPYLATDPLLEPLRKEAEFAQILAISQRRHQAFRERFFPGASHGS